VTLTSANPATMDTFFFSPDNINAVRSGLWCRCRGRRQRQQRH
jgi:hypothetical protein